VARLSDPDHKALSAETRRVLATLPPNNVFRMLSHADAAFPSLMQLTASLWNDAVLSPRLRELAILRTARLLDSAYEWMHHIEVARMVGITEDEIDAIDVGQLDVAEFTGADRAVLEAVPPILRHVRSDDAVFAALRRELSEREIVELHLVVGLYAAIAGVIADCGVEMDVRSGAFDLDHDQRGPRLGS
jgi:alkylhydroperoxidase family enzyme